MYFLETIYAKIDFDTSKVIMEIRIFCGSGHLVGGTGTTYNDIYAQKAEYARIDVLILEDLVFSHI